MDFGLNEQEKLWRDTLDDFVEREGGREYVRRCDIERRYPQEFYDKLIAQGWLGLMIPPEYGGSGADAIMYTLFNEVVCKYSFDFGAIFGIQMFVANNVVAHGTEAQKQRYLPSFLRGEIRFSFSLTEPDAGSDAASITTFAARDGDHFVLNGQKVFSSGAHQINNIILMAARTDRQVAKHRGISLFLVPNTAPGLEMRLLPTLARRINGTNEIFLSDVRVPAEDMVGPLNGGWRILGEHLDLERSAVSGGYVGNAQTAVSDAVRYARQREQFGQPISEFQVIKHMLADMQTEVDAARLMVYRTAWMITQGLPCTTEVAMAKLFASETFLRVATNGMQILGGYAQLPENDMERYWREAKQATVGGGTSQIQRSVIARGMGL